MDSTPSNNVWAPESTPSTGRASSGLRTFSQLQVLSFLMAVRGPQLDWTLSHNVRGPQSTPRLEWATSGLRNFSHHRVLIPLLALGEPQVDSTLFHNIESRVYSWLLKGHKWTQDLLITLGPNSTHGCPKATMDSKPLNLWELFYSQKLICLMYFKPSKCIWNGFHWYKE